MEIQTVLCPIDFSPLSEREVELAVEVCQAFDARLVLHHNLAGIAPDWSKAWEWEQGHPAEQGTQPQAEAKMQEVIAGLPEGVRAEGMITRGPVGLVLQRLAEELPADLLILACHGCSDEDHVSVTERLLEACSCPVLTVHDGDFEPHHLPGRSGGERRPARVVVPTDFSPSAAKATAYAFALARRLPLELHLLHVVAPAGFPALPRNHLTAEEQPREALETAHRQLEALVPEDLMGRVECHVEAGPPVDEILAYAHRVGAEFLVMGEHARSLWRRFFTRDTSKQLLHRAECPVWFVPPEAAA